MTEANESWQGSSFQMKWSNFELSVCNEPCPRISPCKKRVLFCYSLVAVDAAKKKCRGEGTHQQLFLALGVVGVACERVLIKGKNMLFWKMQNQQAKILYIYFPYS